MKKYSVKFWIAFWTISGLFLLSWFFYWQTRNSGLQNFEKLIDFIPMGEENKNDLKSVALLSKYFLNQDDTEKTFLILFQNNMEIRPGGGFIGSFGIVKVKNGEVLEFQTHDTGNFDARIPDGIEPPYPIKETLRVASWKLRDSNYSPDFSEDAKKAEEFYYLGKGGEKFDGIIGITTNVLLSFLKATGPVEIPGYPGTYGDENAVMALEYQVEKAYIDQKIEKGERKTIINDLGKIIIQKSMELSAGKKIELSQIILDDIKKKDIQFYFKDAEIQSQFEKAGWAGKVNQEWKGDYLMAVDANLGAWKSDYSINRSIDYSIDLSGETPKAVLKITYDHTAEKKDFMTKDYLTYLRVYVPKNSYFESSQNFDSPRFGEELGKKYFGAIVKVPLGQEKTVEIRYSLPKNISENYDLLIQKQAGLNNIPVKIHVKNQDGSVKNYETALNSDIILSEIE